MPTEPTAQPAQTGEAAVREYLLWLADPSVFVDPHLVNALEREAANSTDPIDKLKALSRLEHARTVDGERYKVNFIRSAKQWADENQISMDAFIGIGVDETILRAAGIGRRPINRGSRPVRGSSADRSAAVGVDRIKAEVSSWTGQFVLTDVVTRVGGSPMTIRKAVDQMVVAGTVRRLGPAHDYSGRGRAPIVYRVA